MIFAASRIAKSALATLDAIGRAKLARDGIAGRAERLHRTCSELVNVHDLRVAIRGEWPVGACIIVANHVGYLDPVAIAAALPCAPIAKAEIASWPVIGTATSKLGVIFVARDSVWSRARALRRAHAVLRAGVPVLNFPEGTTTDGSHLLPFQRGIFGLARIANVPVIPVAVRCVPELAWHGAARFAPHYWRVSGMHAPEIQFNIGAAIDPASCKSAEELAAVAYHRLAHDLGLARPFTLRVAS